MKRIVIIVSCVAILYVGYLQTRMIEFSHMKVPKKADYLIILGARVKGVTPSLSLENRIQAAANYLTANNNTVAIASGGMGPGEEITEAECIKNELVKLGIDASRIILEDASTDTYENIAFSKEKLPKDAKVGLVVTNDYHLYRSVMIGQDNDLILSGLPAKTPIIAIPKSYIREYLAITKYYLKSFF